MLFAGLVDWFVCHWCVGLAHFVLCIVVDGLGWMVFGYLFVFAVCVALYWLFISFNSIDLCFMLYFCFTIR